MISYIVPYGEKKKKGLINSKIKERERGKKFSPIKINFEHLNINLYLEFFVKFKVELLISKDFP